jgi:hypothetical protein
MHRIDETVFNGIANAAVYKVDGPVIISRKNKSRLHNRCGFGFLKVKPLGIAQHHNCLKNIIFEAHQP